MTSIMMIWSTSLLNFYPPAWSTPQHFLNFCYPPARQISEKSYPPAKVGGGTNYGLCPILTLFVPSIREIMTLKWQFETFWKA